MSLAVSGWLRRLLARYGPGRPRARVWWIAGAYALFASLWIVYSDRVLGAMVSDPSDLVRLSTAKGIAFVTVTSILLLALIRGAYGRMTRMAEELVRKDRALSEAEERFHAYMDASPAIAWMTDDAGRHLYMNRAWEAAFGHPRADWVGQTASSLVPPELADQIRARDAEVIQSGQPMIIPEEPVTIGGRAFTWKVIKFPFRNRLGRQLLGGIALDTTDQTNAEARARELQARLEAVVEHLREGLVIAEPGNGFRHWNPAALQILGFENVEEGRRMAPRFTELFEMFTLEGDRLPRERWPLARIRGGEVLDNLEIRLRRSGTDWERIISYAGAQVRYLDDRQLVFLTLRDVTRNKIAEHQLRQAHDTLELRVRERTAELSTARVRAELADRLKSAFLATMSHELRTPLNSIIGFTGIVLQELPGPLNHEQRKQLGMVRSSARHLLALINDVLDLSKIEAGELQVHREQFDLTASIHQAVEVIRPMAIQRDLTLDVQLGTGLEAMDSDRRRVEQILLNLLNNAVKFTERGGVTLTAERGTGEAPSVRVSVTDTGIGIASEDLMELFQPFRQLDTGLTRLHEGTGLGLAICRRLAGLLGGTIEAHSEPLRGSTFVVTLPLTLPE